MIPRRPLPYVPLLVFAGVVAAIRFSVHIFPASLVSPSLLAAVLFLYAPVPRYLRRGIPAWTRVADPSGSVKAFCLLALAGGAAWFLYSLLPLPPIFASPGKGAPITPAMAIHQLLLIAWPEEVFFRGYLHDAFEESGRDPVVPVALLFAAGHVAIAPSPYRLLTFFPGLLLGWGRKRTGNVYVPAAVHFLYNLFPSWIGGSP